MNLRLSSKLWMACLLGITVLTPLSSASEPETIFNGRDLKGWKGLDGHWTVQDGVIVGETTKEKPLAANSFLVWQGGDVADFEFVAAVRFKGNNSGVQYRSKFLDEKGFVLSGYQMDLHPTANLFGMLYAEKYENRGKIATRGQRIEIDAEGKVTSLGEVRNKAKLIDWEWNTVRVMAVGNRLVHQINGITTIDVNDKHKSALSRGLLGLQLHKGPPMRVEFKDIKLRHLDKKDGEALLSGIKYEPKSKVSPKPKGQSENQVSLELAPTPRIAEEPIPGTDGVPPDLKRLTVAKDFKVELIHTVSLDTQGSWVSLTTDNKGRFYACDQAQKGLFRITLGGTKPLVEKMPVDMSGAQGLAWKSGSLYAFKSGAGIYPVTDSDGDDRLDKAVLISAVSGTGEHGNHALIDSGEPNLLYAMAGNHTALPAKESITGRRGQSWQEDQLLMRQWDPRGHARGILAPGGWVTRFDTEKKTHEVFCMGFRNSYDVAKNVYGDMFTFDADMEWDLGLPWYRPTRICQVVSGGDFGWRSGAGKFPEYYEDSLPASINIGPGSPTGVVSGHTAKFPARYQQSIFALDWTYGRILAVHLEPQGAGYKAEAELFVAGAPLPVTDAVIGADGALYFTTGGRGAQSALMRVVYTGKESTAIAPPPELPNEAKLRRELERFHGVVDAKAVAAAWPHLSSEDRFLRHAARVAIESQPVATWADRVDKEPNSQARITAAVALARMGKALHRAPLIKSLLALDFKTLPVSQQLGILRAYSLVFERLGKPTAEERTALIAAFDPFLPSAEANVNSELLRVLVYLEAPNAVTKGMKLIETRGKSPTLSWAGVEKMNARYGAALERLTKNPPPTAAIGYAYTLRNARTGWSPELHRQYFTFLNVAGKAAGGASYPGYLAGIRDEALTGCTDKERIDLKDLTKEDFNPVPDFAIKPPVGPGREWTLKGAMEATTAEKLAGSDFERGRSLFHSVNCAACHRFKGLGGGVGPDLTSVLNKFTTAYLVEAIINPSKDISDQYQSSTVTVNDGRILTGLAIKEDAKTLLVYSADPKAKPVRVAQTDVESIRPSPVSQMPTNLFNTLNPTELRDLVGYIMSGGDPNDKLYRTKKKKK